MVPTSDHKQIQQWAARHNAVPAQVRILKFDGEPAILTFVIGSPKAAEPDIHPISWDSFFAQFDLLKLKMAFDDKTPRFDIVRVEKQLPDLAH